MRGKIKSRVITNFNSYYNLLEVNKTLVKQEAKKILYRTILLTNSQYLSTMVSVRKSALKLGKARLEFAILVLAYFKIVSIICNSSSKNEIFASVSTLSSICFTELAPIKTEVILLSFNTQAKAICASD